MAKENFIENKDTQKVCSYHMTFATEIYSAINKKADGKTFFWNLAGCYGSIAIIITILLTLMTSRNQQYDKLQEELNNININLAKITTTIELKKAIETKKINTFESKLIAIKQLITKNKVAKNEREN